MAILLVPETAVLEEVGQGRLNQVCEEGSAIDRIFLDVDETDRNRGASQNLVSLDSVVARHQLESPIRQALDRDRVHKRIVAEVLDQFLELLLGEFALTARDLDQLVQTGL